MLAASDLISACFRTTFLLEDPAAVRWLLLCLDYHSGFVAWFNGHEMARKGPVTRPALALAFIADFCANVDRGPYVQQLGPPSAH